MQRNRMLLLGASGVALALPVFVLVLRDERESEAIPAAAIVPSVTGSETPALPEGEASRRAPAALPTISGRILFADGEPVRGLEVFCENGVELDSISATTRDDGTYSAEVPGGGEDYLVAFEHGSTTFTRTVPAGTSGVDFVVPRAAELFVRIVGRETQEELHDVDVYWRRSGEPSFRPLVLGQSVSFESALWHQIELPVARVDLWVVEKKKRAAGFRPASIEGLELASERPSRARFELERGLTARFVMDASNGPLPSGRRVHLVAEGDADAVLPEFVLAAREAVFRVNDADRSAPRSATVLGLAPGRYRLATSDDLVLEPAVLELQEEVVEPIVLSWSMR